MIISYPMDSIYRKKTHSILIGMQTNCPKDLGNSNKGLKSRYIKAWSA
jgi:hypothetical protein